MEIAIRAAMVVLLIMPVTAWAKCKVLDPELQGAYRGGCVKGLAEGHGEATGNARYVGGFVAGRKSGKGIKDWPGGDRYEGEFLDDRRHGRGSYVWGAQSEWPGERYTGEYRGDRRHGQGTYTWPDGRQISGRWQNDQLDLSQSQELQRAARTYAERMAAVSSPGTIVCRDIAVGIAQKDIIRGLVRALEGDRIRIRIEAAGRFGVELDQQKISVGMEISAAAENWYPCR